MSRQLSHSLSDTCTVISPMSKPNEKYLSLQSISSLDHRPNQANRVDFARNVGNLLDRGPRWNSETLRKLSSQTCSEQDQPATSFQKSISSNSIMNSTQPQYLKEDHRLNDTSKSGISTYRLPDENCIDSFPTASTRFQVHDKFQALSRPYDKEMLLKLDFKRNSNHKLCLSKLTGPFLHSGMQDTPRPFNFRHELHIPLEKSSLSGTPTRITPPKNSLSFWPESIAPPLTYNQNMDHSDSGLPPEGNYVDSSLLPLLPSRLANKFQVSFDGFNTNHTCRNSQFQKIFLETKEETRQDRKLMQLSLNESSNHNNLYPPLPAIRNKRKATSPAEDENSQLHAIKSPYKFSPRHESVASKNSTNTCFHSHCGSISSISPDAINDSYSSTISSASSRTSVGSLGRLSPGVISPKSISGINSPLITSQSSNQRHQGPSFRPTFQQKSSYDNRVIGKIIRQSLESATHPQHNKTFSNFRGVFICECCPKKPKKFDNKRDLDTHEQEKQYECAYCPNRFKNKNEAERHQNSLHLRRHSWSCTALSGYAEVFYNSTIRPGEADTCGFCGEDFPRSRRDSGLFIITKQDWDVRINHLTEIHKFGECNHDKKFFRADHFRQHLKHSHAGTSGKWTNMLENACMRDEPIQNPIGSPENINSSESQISSCDTISTVEL